MSQVLMAEMFNDLMKPHFETEQYDSTFDGIDLMDFLASLDLESDLDDDELFDAFLNSFLDEEDPEDVIQVIGEQTKNHLN